MPSHSHSLTRRSNPDDGSYDTGNLHQDESSAATTDRADLGLFNTNNTGSGDAHNNMQPFLVLRYFIKY
jgi:microcystin-dependent protein